MIYVNCPLKQEEIKRLLIGEHEGIMFEFIGKTGIKMSFNVNTADIEKAIAVAKEVIRADPIGRALYFQVTG